ncbi:MAG: hypothetical protein ABI560_08250 [Myxococcales bacterium]
MKQFASAGFRLWNLSLPAKVLYSAFCVLTQLGIVSSALYYGALVGGGFEGVRAYYAGEETAVRGDDRPAVAGPAIDLPSEGSRQLVVAVTYRKLLEVTHFHLFTMPVVLLIVGHLFFATGVGERAKLGWILAASAGVAIHIATPWLVRYGGGALAPLHTFSGIFMGTCMTVVTVYPVYAMWFGRSPERPPSRDVPANV